MSKERWKWIPGYKGYYKISTLGRVTSVDRLIPHHRCGKVRLRGKLRKPIPLDNGYLQITLQKRKSRKSYTVHQLVMLTFVGSCPDGMEVCHNDGSRTNNRLTNLRYDTHSNNQRDRVKHGTNLVGTKNPRAKLTPPQVVQVRTLYASGTYTYKKLAQKFKVTTTIIEGVVRRRTYKNVGDDGSLLKSNQFLKLRKAKGPKVLKAFGKTLTIKEWSALSGIREVTIRNRLEAGWSVARAVSVQPKR